MVEEEAALGEVRFPDELAADGWRDIDTTLVAHSDGSIQPNAVPVDVELGTGADDHWSVKLKIIGALGLVAKAQYTRWNLKTRYVVYRITHKNEKGGTYRYGITAQAPWTKRTNNSKSACQYKHRSPCGAYVMTRVTGYVYARMVEYSLLSQYVVRYGRCPSGNTGRPCK